MKSPGGSRTLSFIEKEYIFAVLAIFIILVIAMFGYFVDQHIYSWKTSSSPFLVTACVTILTKLAHIMLHVITITPLNARLTLVLSNSYLLKTTCPFGDLDKNDNHIIIFIHRWLIQHLYFSSYASSQD